MKFNLKDEIKFSIIYILFFLTTYIISYVRNIIFTISSDIPFHFLVFLLKMLIYGIFCLFIIPNIWRPDGKKSISHYLITIKIGILKSPKFKSFFLGICPPVLKLIGFFIFIILLQYSFDIKNFQIGYFAFIDNIIPALWEEIVFRGVILVILLKIRGLKTAIFIDGLLFGLAHLVNISGANFIGTLGQVIYNVFFGVTLAYLYVKTESLIPCILAHYLNNVFALFMSITLPFLWFFLHIYFVSFTMSVSLLLIEYTFRKK